MNEGTAGVGCERDRASHLQEVVRVVGTDEAYRRPRVVQQVDVLATAAHGGEEDVVAVAEHPDDRELRPPVGLDRGEGGKGVRRATALPRREWLGPPEIGAAAGCRPPVADPGDGLLPAGDGHGGW